MRKVFLENLPRCNRGIDWRKSVGHKVNFIYDDISGVIEIIGYYNTNEGKQKYINIWYENNPYNIETQRFKKGDFLHALLSYKTYKIIPFKYQKGQVIRDDHRNLRITDTYVDFNKSKDKKYYKYECLNCGFKNGVIKEYGLISGIGCSCCAGKIVVNGINDIPTTNPWMINYFPKGYEEAKLYTCCSTKKLFFKCPTCNNIMKRESSIANLYTHKGINCPICSDGYSSISKYFYSVLSQLKENDQIDNFEIEKKFDWCIFFNPYKNKNSYGIYDFVIESHKIIIEIDGGFHRQPLNKKHNSLDEIMHRDKQKDILAINNGYNIIRISDETNFKNNIITSKLAEIFDLSNIDWNRCLVDSISTYAKEICDEKNNDPNLSITDIRKIYPFSETAIRDWLKIGNKLGWCKYNPQEEMKNGMYSKGKIGKRELKPVICLDNGKTFNSISECSRILSNDLGCNLSRKCISMVCNNKRTHTQGYHFKFISDLSKEELMSLNRDYTLVN